MDMQGTPIGSTNQGMKNTTDPATQASTTEGAGPVASDSLAAESTRAGGAFSANRDSEPLAVKGSSSTLANTDTSAATTLAPALDKEEREAKAAWQETSNELRGSAGGMKYPEGAGGQGEFPGATTASGYSGGSTQAKQEMKSGSTSKEPADMASDKSDPPANTTSSEPSNSSSNTTSGVSDPSPNPTSSAPSEPSPDTTSSTNTAAPAPDYTSSVNSEPTQSGKPKGKNLTEGGFDSDPSNNASFNPDIGGENDPGRAAESKFQQATAAVAGGGGPRQTEVTGDGQFDILEGEQSL
ncbi:hypothetical protein MMC12_007585 [Toensbergia leucococca]|nr:hypothetical protein [Toensbergia leucococca]